jgi:hypothetical protein
MIQLTGKSNYERASKELGIDLMSDPDIITRDPEVNAKVTAWFLKNNKKSMEGIKTGDVDKLSQGINGGVYGKSVGAEDRRVQTARAEAALAGMSEADITAQAPLVEQTKPAPMAAKAPEFNFSRVPESAAKLAPQAVKVTEASKVASLEKAPAEVVSSETIVAQTERAKMAESKPEVVVVPAAGGGGGTAGQPNVRDGAGAAKGSAPMVSRNMDNSIQRITAGQLSYSSA